MLRREQFACSLRTDKRKKILAEKRLKLLSKSKFARADPRTESTLPSTSLFLKNRREDCLLKQLEEDFAIE